MHLFVEFCRLHFDLGVYCITFGPTSIRFTLKQTTFLQVLFDGVVCRCDRLRLGAVWL